MNLELIVFLTVFAFSTATPGYPSSLPMRYGARSSYSFGTRGPYRIDTPRVGFGYAGRFGLNLNANNNFNYNFIRYNRGFSNYINYNGVSDDYGRRDTDHSDDDSYIFDEDDDDDKEDSYQYGYRHYRDNNRRGYYESSNFNFNDIYSDNGYTGNVDSNYVNMNNYVGFNRYTSNRPGYMNIFLRRPFWGYRSSSMIVANKPYASFFIPNMPKLFLFHQKRPVFTPVLPLIKPMKPSSKWRLPVFYQKKTYPKKY